MTITNKPITHTASMRNLAFSLYMQQVDTTLPTCTRCGMRMEEGDRPGQYFCVPCTDELAVARRINNEYVEF